MGIFSRLFGKPEKEAPVQVKVKADRPEVHVELKAVHEVTSTEGMDYQEQVDYFKGILVTEFPEYTIRENVEVTELVGDANDKFKLYQSRPYREYKAEWGQPYNFVMYKDGEVKGVLMIGGERSHHAKVKYLISRMYAKKIEVPYLGFYTHMPNKISFVVNHIQKSLK